MHRIFYFHYIYSSKRGEEKSVWGLFRQNKRSIPPTIVLSTRHLPKYARPPDGDNAGYQKRTIWAWVESLFPLFPTFLLLAVSKRKALTSAWWTKFIVLDVCTDTQEPDILKKYVCYNICMYVCGQNAVWRQNIYSPCDPISISNNSFHGYQTDLDHPRHWSILHSVLCTRL